MDKYIVVDIETTGHIAEKDAQIIDIGIVVIQDNEIIQEYTTLLKPNKPIPAFISHLTGITDEDVVDAPTFPEIAQDIRAFFQNGYLVAHNVPFDLGFLNESLKHYGFKKITNPVLDTVELTRILYPQAPSYKLNQLAEYLNLNNKQTHRALSDAYITAEILLKLMEKMSRLPYETVTHLLKLEKYLHSDLYTMLDEIGRASCREREKITEVAESFKKKRQVERYVYR